MSEADLKKSLEEYLNYQQNAGKLLFARLNAGDFIVRYQEAYGESRRRIKGVPKGWADFIVLMKDRCIFIECKGERGKLRKEQEEFFLAVTLMHHEFYVIWNVDEIPVLLGLEKWGIPQ